VVNGFSFISKTAIGFETHSCLAFRITRFSIHGRFVITASKTVITNVRFIAFAPIFKRKSFESDGFHGNTVQIPYR
jgi:hypothetical protein